MQKNWRQHLAHTQQKLSHLHHQPNQQAQNQKHDNNNGAGAMASASTQAQNALREHLATWRQQQSPTKWAAQFPSRIRVGNPEDLGRHRQINILILII
jgi:hypothetical protein